MKPTRVRTAALAGVLAVALLLAGGRWASYLGVAPLFLSDFLAVCAIVNYWLGVRSRRRTALAGAPTSLLLVFAWVSLRFALSFRYDLDGIRDFAPYAYVLLGVLAWSATRRSTLAMRERTWTVLYAALTVHTAWFFVVQIFLRDLPNSLPTLPGGVHLLQPRGDFDAAVSGIYAAVSLHEALTRRGRRGLFFVGFAAGWATVLATNSRAALLGSLLATTVALAAGLGRHAKAGRGKQILLGFGPLIAAAVIGGIAVTPVGDKLIAVLLPQFASSSDAAIGGIGTAQARQGAWDAILRWTLADPLRAIFGAGFGVNIMSESGAGSYLLNDFAEGDNRPRSPHNYWLGTVARLGLVGVALIIAVVVAFVRAAWRRSRLAALDRFTFLIITIPIALLIPASLGVILESPFGAIPFWWCTGATLGLAADDRVHRHVRQGKLPVKPAVPVSDLQ